jgi:hypothetical protein
MKSQMEVVFRVILSGFYKSMVSSSFFKFSVEHGTISIFKKKNIQGADPGAIITVT